ncbi:hypothetical protein HYY74_02685 [Candidatus Woesearchaeota archaeon]|nr:hypothetical protein [Candidatus Woesearchaeota archaeon]
MGDLFEKMVENYRAESRAFWEEILNAEKILSEEEARDINGIVVKVRKGV